MKNNGAASKPVGNLKISQEVVATIAEVTVLEIAGVASLAPFTGKIKSVFTKNNASKSINVNLGDDVAVIDVHVNLRFGAKIPEVSASVQTSVKDAVQTMTGIVVSKVNVYVDGIDFDEAKPA